jgi:hypothetical protein
MDNVVEDDDTWTTTSKNAYIYIKSDVGCMDHNVGIRFARVCVRIAHTANRHLSRAAAHARRITPTAPAHGGVDALTASSGPRMPRRLAASPVSCLL